jgi:glucokinase
MKYILGIDVGGTKIAAALVDEKFRLSKAVIIPTSQTNLAGQLEDLIKGYSGFSGIGIGMPGQVLKSGVVTKLGNVNWSSINLKQLFEGKFKMTVSLINDAKAFALAEATLGAGKGLHTVAGVILGTGVGVGFIQDKQIYFGKDGVAGELEHVTMLDGRLFRDHKKEAGIFKTAQSAKAYLRTLISMIVLSVNPEVIVLGGAWSKLPGMQALTNKLAINVGGYTNKTPVKISKLKHAGIIGAALPLLKP